MLDPPRASSSVIVYSHPSLNLSVAEFKSVEYLGIYNPRTNTVSRIAVADIPDDVIAQVETEVICYEV